MVAEVFAGIAGFKSIMDTLKGFKDIGDANTRNAVAVELQEKILAAYQAQTALTERVSDLEKEVAHFEAWEAEKNRYQMTDYGGATFAYELKKAMSNGEPPHRICPNCYEERKRSVLQFKHKSYDAQDHYECPRCKTKFSFGVRREQERQSQAFRGSNDWRV